MILFQHFQQLYSLCRLVESCPDPDLIFCRGRRQRASSLEFSCPCGRSRYCARHRVPYKYLEKLSDLCTWLQIIGPNGWWSYELMAFVLGDLNTDKLVTIDLCQADMFFLIVIFVNGSTFKINCKRTNCRFARLQPVTNHRVRVAVFLLTQESSKHFRIKGWSSLLAYYA